jgi:hypothetical protein
MSDARSMVLAAVITLALAVGLGFGVGDLYFATYNGREVTGTAVGIYHEESDTPKASEFLVQLDDGPRVVVGGTGSLPYREGQRLVVREGRSRFFGIRRYRFERFVAQ